MPATALPATSANQRNSKQEILAYLAQWPHGQRTSNVAAAVDLTVRRAATRLKELEDTMRVVGIVAHIGPRQGKIWCATEHEATARANLHLHGAKAVATVWKVRKAVEMAPGQKARVRSSVGEMVKPKRDPKRPKVVLCPHGVDMRFSVKAEDVQAHFAALPPGAYSAPASSWVDAVVGRG